MHPEGSPSSEQLSRAPDHIEPKRWEVSPHKLPCVDTLGPGCGGAIVVGDIHNDIDRADAWIDNTRFDRVILLGDYWDAWDDSPEDAQRVARWVHRRLRDARVTMIIGNHDAAYRWPEVEAVYCPGFTQEKAEAISWILGPEDWARMKLAVVVDGFLLSHAGFSYPWINETSVEEILRRCALAEKRARRGVDPIFTYGQPPGGPLWVDYSSFIPIPGVSQIMGHTPGHTIRYCSIPGSENVCIDVGLSVGAVISNGHVTITRCPI